MDMTSDLDLVSGTFMSKYWEKQNGYKKAFCNLLYSVVFYQH